MVGVFFVLLSQYDVSLRWSQPRVVCYFHRANIWHCCLHIIQLRLQSSYCKELLCRLSTKYGGRSTMPDSATPWLNVMLFIALNLGNIHLTILLKERQEFVDLVYGTLESLANLKLLHRLLERIKLIICHLYQ